MADHAGFISGTGAEVTPICEIGPYNFTGAMCRAMIDDYSAEVRPQKAA